MSASDSDYSIDWLASDDEDCESLSEPDCEGGAGQSEALPSPVTSGAESRVPQTGRQGAESDHSGAEEGAGGDRGTPSRSSEGCGGRGRGLLFLGREAQHGPLWRSALYLTEASPGTGPRAAPKRPRSPGTEVYWPWQHPSKTPNDQLFARKVRLASPPPNQMLVPKHRQ